MPHPARLTLLALVTFNLVACSSGNHLEGVSTAIETRPLTRVNIGVRLEDDAGQPLANFPVTFSLDPAGAAELEATSAETDETGVAYATVVTGDEGSFSLVALAPSATALRVRVDVTAPDYAYCVGMPDCTDTQQCLELTTSQSAGAFCTSLCAASTECPIRGGFTGVCMNADTLGGTCFQECNVDTDCLGSSICLEFTDTDDVINSVCLPNRL